MLSFINLPMKIINILEGNISPREIAAGVCLGVFLGFTPLNAPMALLLAAFFFIFKINRAAALLTLPLFKAVYFFGMYKFADAVGFYILDKAGYLTGFWRQVTHLPVLAYLDINNTLIAGGLLISIVLSIPIYFIAKRLAIFFGVKYSQKIKNSPLAKWISIVIKNKAESQPSSPFKRLNIKGIVIAISALLVFHFGVGFFVSPAVSSLVADNINKYSNAKISIDKVNVWPLTLSFTLKGMKVFDPEVTGARIAKIDNCSARVSPLGVFSRRLVFSNINISGAEINVEARPDGSFNINNLAVSKKPGSGMKWRSLMQKRDLFGRIYEIIKKRFSKKDQEKIKEEQKSAEKITKVVQQLPKGKLVHFKNVKDFYIFEIRKLDIANASITLSANGNILEITKARMRLGQIVFDPENGVKVGLVDLHGNVNKGAAPAGRFDIFFSQGVDKNAQKAVFNAELEDIDMDATRFIYEDSLPIYVVRGFLTLKSKTYIEAGAIDSKNEINLRNHELLQKAGGNPMMGFVPVPVVCEAINRIDPLKLNFGIGGTLEKPEFKGFHELIMTLIKPHIANFKDNIINEGINALGELFK